MNELSTTRTPEVIGVEIRTIQKSAFEYNLRCAVEIGRKLTEAKELVAHGEWLDWLKRETGYSQPSASRFMKVYERLGAEQIGLEGAELAEKYSMLNNLESSKIFLLVSMPEKDMDEFLDEHPVEELKAGTVNELKEAIRERDEWKNAAEKYERDAGAFGQQATEWQTKAEELTKDVNEKEVEIFGLKEQIKELESRPVDVAVAEPDPAEIERRAREIAEADIKAAVEAAEKKAAEEREKLQKKLEKAEAAKKKAEESAANAGSEDKAEAEKLRTEAEEAKGEIERLRKQLAMSDASVTTFKIHFESWQKAHAAMMEALEAIPAETADKLRAAINAAIKGWEGADND